LHLKF